MTLRQTIQAAPAKAAELITKLSATSNQAVKTRENLFAELRDELTRYVEIEEQHLLPLLRKHPDTKDIAVNALKGNKDLRASLEKLSALPKDNDAFLGELAELNKGFQQHVRNERKELLPAVLKAFSDEEAATVAANIEGAVADAEQAKRDEKREQAAQARRQAEEAEKAAAAERAAVAEAEKAKREEQAQAKRQAEQAAAAERAVVRAQEEAERTAREATEKVVEVMERGAASVQDRARKVTENVTERAQQVASDTREALTIYSDASRQVADDLQAVRTSSAISGQAVVEVYSAWTEWFGKAARANVEASLKLMRCRSVKQVAEVQKELATSVVHDWMEGRAKMLQIAQRTSEQALSPLDGRVSEAA